MSGTQWDAFRNIPLPRHVQVRLGDIGWDPRVNTRPLDERRVGEMLAQWFPHAFGTPVVSRRDDGSMIALDANHRVHVKKRRGESNDVVWVEEFRGLTLAQEAALFLFYNEQKAVTFFDKHNASNIAGAAAGAQDHVAVAHIVEQSGWQRSRSGNRPGQLTAIKQCLRIYHGDGTRSSSIDGPSALGATLRTLFQSWGHDPRGGHQILVAGLGRVYLRYGNGVDERRMIRALSKEEVRVFLDKEVVALHQVRKGEKTNCAAELFVEKYNAVSPKDRIASWRA